MSSVITKNQDPFVKEPVFKAEFLAIRKEIKELGRELRGEMQEMATEIIKGVQLMLDEQDRKNDQKFATKNELADIKGELSQKIDQNYHLAIEMLGEIKAMREELTVGAYQRARFHDQAHDHEKRLIKIEKHLQIA